MWAVGLFSSAESLAGGVFLQAWKMLNAKLAHHKAEAWGITENFEAKSKNPQTSLVAEKPQKKGNSGGAPHLAVGAALVAVTVPGSCAEIFKW